MQEESLSSQRSLCNRHCYCPPTKLWEGNVLGPVCLSFCPQGGHYCTGSSPPPIEDSSLPHCISLFRDPPHPWVFKRVQLGVHSKDNRLICDLNSICLLQMYLKIRIGNSFDIPSKPDSNENSLYDIDAQRWCISSDPFRTFELVFLTKSRLYLEYWLSIHCIYFKRQ